MSKIIGDQNPQIGKKYRYSIIDDTEINLTLSNEVVTYIWEIYLQQSTGKWVNITSDKNPKIGKEVTYDFTQKAKGRTYKLLVKRATKKHFSQSYNFEELKEFLIVPTSSTEQKIQKVILYNKGGRNVNKASYTDTLVAKAFCIGMFGKTIEFQVWEDDAKGSGHDAEINKNNAIPIKYKGVVDVHGVAQVKIPLSDNPKLFQEIANRYMMAGEKDEGAFHEYYVTASYLGSIQGASQVNVEVENPSYKKEKISKESALYPIGLGSKRQDVAQKITDAFFVDEAGERMKRVFIGDRVRVKISTEGFKDKYLQYVVWEKDISGNHDEIYRSNRIQIPYGVHVDEGFIITEEIFKKGIDFSMGNYFIPDPDAKKQNYFLEIIPLDMSISSKKFGIDDKIGLIEVEKVRSASKVENTEASNGDSNEVCPNCEKNFTWDEIKAIFGEEDKDFRTDCVNWINKYKLDFGINTCVKKAHFLSQVAAETHFRKNKMKEGNIKYTPKNIRSGIFGNRGILLEKRRQIEEFCNERPDQKKLLNFLYAKENGFGNGNESSGDGYNFRGKGLVQLTGKDNYKSAMGLINEYVPSKIYEELLTTENRKKYYTEFKFEENKKQKIIRNIVLLDFITYYDMPTEPKYAVLSALADWKGKGLSDSALMVNDVNKVKNIRKRINAAGLHTDVAEIYFNKSIENLKVNKCKIGSNKSTLLEGGTVILVSGNDKKSEKDPVKNIYWMMYKTMIYKNITLNTFKKLKTENKLPNPDYTTYLSRDTHQTSTSDNKTLKHSDKRFGQYNEIPSGEYFLVPGLSGQKYTMYVIDSESKTADSGSGIRGPHGDRGGVALHQYCPRYSVGCFTFNSGKNTAPVENFYQQISDLKLGDDRPVHFIIEARQVQETLWDNPEYGTKKWTGI